ncbi:FGGY-family carbohydrate kinase [Roseibium sp. SCP14]|uniref:FGGY-family carbohydrate kinase n=1 Tax=Roseibium sp. SCP14 TaxID=3141375 RepID=UPI0033351EA2
MRDVRHVGVIDIGKTNAKVAVVDIDAEREIGVLTRPNKVLSGPPFPHYDIDGHWHFICDALKQLHSEFGIDALSVTTHGASAVLLTEDGSLAAPVLDYEFDGPQTLATDYDAIRPEFSETGSPRLGMGLNVGAQLYWQFRSDPTLLDRTATILTYPQYWTYRLTGIRANEVTSLGCHTDLWNPSQNCFSSLVKRMGLAGKMAPVKRAVDTLDPVLPAVAAVTGLPENVAVSCGIHDSNASLLPHLLRRQAPFSVVSTGTWVIVLALGGETVHLDPTRDTLINVNAFGDAVPSARFMGGREFEMVLDGRPRIATDTDARNVLDQSVMLLPAVDPRSGPFQGRSHRWTVTETELTDGERYAALSFYLALMTAECLAMTGAKGPIIVEGPFASNSLYTRMLETASGRPVEAAESSVTGTSIGAALLAKGPQRRNDSMADNGKRTLANNPAFSSYAARWRDLVR